MEEISLTRVRPLAYYTKEDMNRIAKILTPLLVASFLSSHGELFSFAAPYLAKSMNPIGGLCVNSSCCCDHEGPEGNKAVCGMCTTSSANTKALPNDRCCLAQANCDSKSGRPVLTVNKDLQSVRAAIGKLDFADAVVFHPLENRIKTSDFKLDIFHPPQV